MKLTIVGIVAIVITAFALQISFAQAPADTIKVRGCLSGDGSDANPWSLRGAVLPNPVVAPPAGPPAAGAAGGGGGGRGDGGGRGAGGRGAGGRGDGGGAAAGAGRGGDGRGAAPPAAAAAPSQPPVDLRLTGVDMQPWRNMFVELDGTLGPRPATGPREFRVNAARSAYGECR